MDTKKAHLKQKRFMEMFGCADWDVYRKDERELLTYKVGMAIVGRTQTEHEVKQHIKKVTDTIINEDEHDDGDSGDTWMSIIILLVKPPESDYYCHPVFRVPKYTGRAHNRHAFIDCIGQVYKNWNDFMENNKLPQSEICYPINGVYRKDTSGQVLIGFSHTKSNVPFNALNAVDFFIRPLFIAQEMFSDVSFVREILLLIHDVTSYALFFCHAVVDGQYLDGFNHYSEQQLLELKSKIFETIPCGGMSDNKVRYLAFVGISNHIKISKSGVYSNNYIFQLSFPCDKVMFTALEISIQGLINNSLTGDWIKDILFDIKQSAEFFSKYDLPWAIKVTKQIESKIKVEKAFCGIMAGFYSFMEYIIEAVKTSSLSKFKLTPGDIVEIVKICINKQPKFYTKFGKLCKGYILPRMENVAISRSTHKVQRCAKTAENIIYPALSDPEILCAASQAVGSVLTSSNAKIAHADSDFFVIITDSNIQANVVHIFWDMEKGNVTAIVIQNNCHE